MQLWRDRMAILRVLEHRSATVARSYSNPASLGTSYCNCGEILVRFRRDRSATPARFWRDFGDILVRLCSNSGEISETSYGNLTVIKCNFACNSAATPPQ